MQRLWLPREGATEIDYFAVTPRKEGACRLRFSVYYEQNVIQSFRIGAVAGPAPAQKRSVLLSKALGHRTRLDAAYLPMVEYSLARGIDQFVATAQGFTPRTISIVTNDSNGKSVITVKLPGDFRVNVSERLPGYVSNLQDLLKELSGAAATYPFNDLDNSGTREQLERALRLLADGGREIYNDLFDGDVWRALSETLKEPDHIIQVAQILREKVIPWAFIYSRNLQALSGDRDEKGKLVNMPVCLAALPTTEFGGLLGGGKKWQPPAFVFLNACGTSNYSPEAVSPFLRSFVDQLGASGLVGTEILVWDVFAAEVGKRFLQEFLQFVPVGEALLRVRRMQDESAGAGVFVVCVGGPSSQDLERCGPF